MDNSQKSLSPTASEPATSDNSAAATIDAASLSPEQQAMTRTEARRWWTKLFLQPVLLLACGAILITRLGVAQRLGFISAGSGSGLSTLDSQLSTLNSHGTSAR